MDIIDKKLLYLLDLNSRMNDTEIAKQLKTSKQVVNYRIKRLLKEQKIVNCQTMLNIRNFDRNIYAQIYGKFLDCENKKVNEILNYLLDHKNVGYLATCFGKFDFTLSLVAKDLQDFDAQIREIFGKHPKELRQYIISMRISTKRFPRNYLWEEKKVTEEKQTFDKITNIQKPDQLDKDILSYLALNSRISALEISEKLKKPFSTVRFRIKQLEKNRIIVGYSTLMNLERLGIQNYKIFIKLREQNEELENKLLLFAKNNQNIPWFQKTLGNHDYEMRIETEGQERFQEIIRQLRDEFSGIIEDIETITILRELKEDYGILLK